MLAAHHPLRSVHADGNQSEQRVEVIATQSAGVGADAQVALHHHRLHRQGQRQRNHGRRDREGRAARIEPDDARRGQRQLEGAAQKLASEIGQAADAVDHVAALGHVRLQPALEVAVAEARDLFQKSPPQPRFQMPPQAQQAGSQRKFEKQQSDKEQNQRRDRAHALAREAKVAPQVEKRRGTGQPPGSRRRWPKAGPAAARME